MTQAAWTPPAQSSLGSEHGRGGPRAGGQLAPQPPLPAGRGGPRAPFPERPRPAPAGAASPSRRRGPQDAPPAAPARAGQGPGAPPRVELGALPPAAREEPRAPRPQVSGTRRPVRGRAWSQPRGVSGPRGNIFPVKWVTGGAEEREGASPWGTRGFRRGLRKRRVPRAGPPDRRARAQAPGRSPSAVVAPAREAGARRQAGSPGPGAWGPVAGSERRPPGLSLEITLGLWPPVGSAGGARRSAVPSPRPPWDPR